MCTGWHTGEGPWCLSACTGHCHPGISMYSSTQMHSNLLSCAFMDTSLQKHGWSMDTHRPCDLRWTVGSSANRWVENWVRSDHILQPAFLMCVRQNTSQGPLPRQVKAFIYDQQLQGRVSLCVYVCVRNIRVFVNCLEKEKVWALWFVMKSIICWSSWCSVPMSWSYVRGLKWQPCTKYKKQDREGKVLQRGQGQRMAWYYLVSQTICLGDRHWGTAGSAMVWVVHLTHECQYEFCLLPVV